MQFRIVLMVGFRRIKLLQRHHLRHNRPRKHLGLVELRDVSLRNPLLLLTAIEDYRPVLRAFIRFSSVGSSATEKNTRNNSP